MKNAIIAAVVVLAGIGIFWYAKSNQNTAPQSQPPTSAPIETTAPSASQTGSENQTTSGPSAGNASSGITMAEVAKHNNSSSCWSAINGSVYDLTSWINQHPGGEEAILSICGIDGSDAFNAQHGGQRKPERELESFKIGDLKS